MVNKSIYLAECEADSDLQNVSAGIISLLKDKLKRIAIFRPFIVDTSLRDPIIEFLLNYFHFDQPYESTYGYTLEELEIALVENRFSSLIENMISIHQDLCIEYDFVVVIGLDHFAYPIGSFGLINHTIARNLQLPYIPLLSGNDKSFEHINRQIILEQNGLSRDHIEQIAFFITRLDTTLCDRFKVKECDPKTPIFYIPNNSDLNFYLNGIDKQFLHKRIQRMHTNVITPAMFEYGLYQQAKKNIKKIVLPECDDERILHAANILLLHNAVDLVLLGHFDTILLRTQGLGLNLSKATIIDPDTSALKDVYASQLYKLRKNSGMTLQHAYELLKHRTYFGTMMVYASEADAMVCGATHTTQETIRPALQIIKTSEGISRVSSLFFMCFEEKVLVYADCAINENPTAEELAQIAIASANSAKAFGIEPRIAMLSYSTGNSGDGDDVDKVREATQIVRMRAPELKIEGPIQYDAAIDPYVAHIKLPQSDVAGHATVFIFPDLNAGNNTYKAVQRSSSAIAIGPILQGLRKPINDLSRGCNVNDIVNTVLISAIQAQQVTS